jgi:hypothetical protein
LVWALSVALAERFAGETGELPVRLGVVMDGPHVQVERLQAAEGALDLAQGLVAPHHGGGVELYRGQVGPQHVEAIERRLLRDLLLIACRSSRPSRAAPARLRRSEDERTRTDRTR